MDLDKRLHDYVNNLTTSSQKVLGLARLLQCAAFAQGGGHPSIMEEMVTMPNFNPAPVYLDQARAMEKFPLLCQKIIQSSLALRREARLTAWAQDVEAVAKWQEENPERTMTDLPDDAYLEKYFAA